MKYENKEKALSLIKEIENQEKIIGQAKSLMRNSNHYNIYICAVDAYSKINIPLDDQQLHDLLTRIIDDTSKQIEKYKKEIEDL